MPPLPSEPPVSRRLVLLLAVLLALQLRHDRPEETSGPWSGPAGLRILAAVRERIRERFPQPPPDEALFRGAVQGMIQALGDPYTHFLPPSEARHLTDVLEDAGEGGLGIVPAPVEGTGVRVLVVLDDSPAARAGLHEGEVILAVDGVTLADLPFDRMRDRLRGPVGSRVILRLRADKNERDVTVTRGPLPSYGLFPGKFVEGHPGVAYLALNVVSETLPKQVETEVKRLEREGMKALILDLRLNPGGSLLAGEALADLFLDAGIIVNIADRGGKIRTRTATPGSLGNFPVAILTGRGTASAAELFSAALRENGRATLVGDRTFGKGKIQELMPIDDGGALLQLTVAHYTTPKGNPVDGVGLAPDMSVPLTEEEWKRLAELWPPIWAGKKPLDPAALRDPQLDAALEAVSPRKTTKH